MGENMVDRYTKVILTIIAVCLVYLCFALPPWLSTAQAATRSAAETVDVNIVSVSGRKFSDMRPD